MRFEEVSLEMETNRDLRQERNIASHRNENWISQSEQKRGAACCPWKLRNVLSVIEGKNGIKGSLNTFLGVGEGRHDESFYHLCKEMRAVAFHQS